MLALQVNDGYGNAGEEAERYKALLAIGEPIIFESEGSTCEDMWSVGEIETMSLQV